MVWTPHPASAISHRGPAMEEREGVDIATLTYLNPAPFFGLEPPRWPVEEALLVYASLVASEDLMRV